MIAMALACKPDVLIADEPTTALDVTVQQQILALIGELVTERGMALVLISHDLGLVAQNVRRMLVMYGGSVVESGSADEVFKHPAHPYTRGLLAARPNLAQRLHATAATACPPLPAPCPTCSACRPAAPCRALPLHRGAGLQPRRAARVELSPTHAFKCRRAEVVLDASIQ
jgi:peptide/nickel transport system ATP-binding protein